MKRKLFYLFFFLAVVAASVIGGFHYHSAKKEAEFKNTAVPFIKDVIPKLSQWDPELSHSLMAPSALKKIPRDYFDKVVITMGRLGTLEELQEPVFEEVYSGSTLDGQEQTVVSYTVDARYSSGPAEITISLINNGESFDVNSFNVHSEALRTPEN